MNLPPNWRGMGFTAKAAYMVSVGFARDYSDACSKLARHPRGERKKPAAVYTPSTRQVRLPYAD